MPLRMLPLRLLSGQRNASVAEQQPADEVDGKKKSVQNSAVGGSEAPGLGGEGDSDADGLTRILNTGEGKGKQKPGVDGGRAKYKPNLSMHRGRGQAKHAMKDTLSLPDATISPSSARNVRTQTPPAPAPQPPSRSQLGVNDIPAFVHSLDTPALRKELEISLKRNIHYRAERQKMSLKLARMSGQLELLSQNTRAPQQQQQLVIEPSAVMLPKQTQTRSTSSTPTAKPHAQSSPPRHSRPRSHSQSNPNPPSSTSLATITQKMIESQERRLERTERQYEAVLKEAIEGRELLQEIAYQAWTLKGWDIWSVLAPSSVAAAAVRSEAEKEREKENEAGGGEEGRCDVAGGADGGEDDEDGDDGDDVGVGEDIQDDGEGPSGHVMLTK